MKYYFYIYTKSGKLIKRCRDIPEKGNSDDTTAIRKALSACIKENAGFGLHVHAFVSRYGDYNRVNTLNGGCVRYYKRDGGRFAANPANTSSCSKAAFDRFQHALREALSWTPATPQDNQTYLNLLLTKKANRLTREKEAHNIAAKGPELNADQQKALRIMLSGKNVFITGGAGTGKTYLLHKYLDLVPDKNVIVCAPTGVAALQAGGATLHRTFGIPVKCIPPDEPTGQISAALAQADIIIIDEISMCRVDVFDFVIRKILAAEKQSHRYKQVIVIGDFYQLPPVVVGKRKAGEKYSDKDLLCGYYGKDAAEGYAFLTLHWAMMHFEPVILTEIIRQRDKKFSNALNQVRVGNAEKLAWIMSHSAHQKDSKAITLCSRNKDAARINEERLAALTGSGKTYDTDITGKENISASDKPVPDRLTLKLGARVMLLINDPADTNPLYSNGSLGTVERLAQSFDDSLGIKLDTGDTIELAPHKWEVKRYVVQEINKRKIIERETIATMIQFPIKLAYAVTIHKFQGQTYDGVSVQPDRCFAPGQLYVALSRVKSVDKLYLLSDLQPKQLICSDTVRKFYNSISDLQVTIAPESKENPEKKNPKRAVVTSKAEVKNAAPPINDGNDIGYRYMRAAPSVQITFKRILASLSHQEVSGDNWSQVYKDLSSTKQSIASAALGKR